jgi:hypothetical protein
MNDLQLISGYMQLGKMDKLQACVKEMMRRGASEGHYLRLQNPKLALELFARENAPLDYVLRIELQQPYAFNGNDRAMDIMLKWIDTTLENLPNKTVVTVTLEQLPDRWAVHITDETDTSIRGSGDWSGNEVEA